MDLPSHLRALPPNAVEVLRYLSKLDMGVAGIDEICEEVGLSERGFGKAIRSLVTKGYVVMDGDQIYRLTDQGRAVAEELGDYFDDEAYDEDALQDMADAADMPEETPEVPAFSTPVPVIRRLVLVMPREVAAQQPAHLVVGFAPLAEQTEAVEVVMRVSVLNGEPDTPQEASFALTNAAAVQDFLMTAGPYHQARVKVEVFQLGPNPDDIAVAGGMYVDVDVRPQAASDRIAYGVDISLTPES